MAYTDKSKQYVYDYKAKKIKRIPLDVQLSEYELIKATAEASGMSVNGYIKQAIRQAMDRDEIKPQAIPQGDIPGTPGGRG